MRDIVRIETTNLLLRPLTERDGARVARFTGDFDVARMTSAIPHPQILASAEGWILIGLARGRDYVFAVDLPGEGLIGCIGAHYGKSAVIEVGYWFGKPFWGQGFASEAVPAFVAEAQKLGPLVSGHFTDNPASGRVLEKSGFAYTGEVVQTFSLARGKRVACRRLKHTASHLHWHDEAALCAASALA